MSEAALVHETASRGSNRGHSQNRGRGRGCGRPRPRNDAVNMHENATVLPAEASNAPQRGRARHRRPYRGNIRPAVLPQEILAAEATSLQARLTAELFSNSAECSICMNTLDKAQQVHSCTTCFALTHLKCISEWAQRSIHDAKERAALIASTNASAPIMAINWRCPSCQTNFSQDLMPREYRCFCKRVVNPKVPPKHIVPHSCGQSCGRTRPQGCTHPCSAAFCHPGPCEPCLTPVKTTCYCGKEEKWFQCSAINSSKGEQEIRSCSSICGKTLACGLHACSSTCHAGPCEDCQSIRDKTCFCGQTSISEICSTLQHPSSSRIDCFDAKGDKLVGEFQCELKCPWTYDCNLHKCEQNEGICHPHTSSQSKECLYSPSKISSCPCGKSPLSISRTSCSDPIPSCSQLCQKILLCGHACQETCHKGACPSCREPVTSLCRCGSEKRTLPCSALNVEKDGFTCHRQCKALRHCGRHVCGRLCCPLSFQESLLGKKSKRFKTTTDAALMEDPFGLHVCPFICGRILSCGLHSCERNDHRGVCGRCLASEFSEMSCACGGTILLPPIPCGTRMNCTLPCHRPEPPCGHPKLAHPCHENDTSCPPCSFLVEKECQCEKKLHVKNVRCSQEKVSCGTLCNKVLSCGAHRCRLVCHQGDCEPCTQICGKPRKPCGHPHEAPCHAPSSCSSSVPCQVMVDAKCACGNNVQRLLCGSSTAKPIGSAEQILPCNETCAVLKRNAALAAALGIDPDRTPVAQQSKQVEYEEATLEYYATHRDFGNEVETSLNNFLQSDRQTLLLPPMRQPHRHFIKAVAALWNLGAQSLDAEPNRAVYVSKKSRSTPFKPSNSLASEYSKFIAPRAVQQQGTSLERSSSQTKPLFNALLLNSVFGLDEETLRNFITPLTQGMLFTLEWMNEEDVLFKPETSSDGKALDVKSKNIKALITSDKRITARGGVDGVHLDENGSIEWREDWTQVSTDSKWQQPVKFTPKSAAQNRWQALTASDSSAAVPNGWHS